MKGRISPRTDTTETNQAKVQAVVPLIAPVVVEPPQIAAEPQKARYSFNLGPNVTSTHSDWEAGIGVSFANDSLVHWPPFEVEVADAIRSAESEMHNVLSLSATVQPIPDIRLESASISFYLLGSVQHTADVSDDAQGVGEIDFTVIDTDPLAVALSALGYYDRTDPSDGAATSGPSAGVGAAAKVHGRLTMYGEYDFRNDFAGEDSFLCKVAFDLPTKSRTTFTPFVTLEKHSRFSAGLTLNVAEARKARPARLR